MRLHLCTAPMVQINTPYPATANLTAYLLGRGYSVSQSDPSLGLILKLFSKAGILRLKQTISQGISTSRTPITPSIQFFLDAADDYAATIESVIAYLQGKDPSLAIPLAARHFVPEGPRFASLDPAADGSAKLSWAFGALGTSDQARHIASLCLDDLADTIKEAIDPNFAFARYGEQLAASAASFDGLQEKLCDPAPTLLDQIMVELAHELLQEFSPDTIGFSVPFAGAMYGALKMAQAIKQKNKKIKIILGGGYVNTELRSLSDSRVFETIDFICFDDGERPLECVLEYIAGKRPKEELLRTMMRESGKVTYFSSPKERDISFAHWPAPTYKGLPLQNYIRMFESLNPMQRLWSDFHWNKLTLAHGCYWRKCSFCDTSLDYIERYEAGSIDLILDRMESMIKETGYSGFHFVDEAAPPKVLEQLARGILKRGLRVSWWGNIRFEKTFTPELTHLMREAGCIAVTGGLEVASERILKLIQKGVSIEQVARVTKNFSKAGIFVHAYLMFGFPTETIQETVDSLEVVRQLFLNECLHSAFWHRFAVTIHSPIGKNPEKYGITLRPPKAGSHGIFAQNDIPFLDSTKTPHEALGQGLNLALFNYMHGQGLQEDLRSWFEGPVPKTKMTKSFIRQALL